MAVELNSESSDAYTARLYAMPTESDMAFFKSNQQQLFNTIETNVSAQQFFSNMRHALELTDYNRLANIAAMTAHRVATYFDEDVIKPLIDLSALQDPPASMIRWLMANPRVRKLHQSGGCAGYGEVYTDLEPNAVGFGHSEYMVVMNGLEQTDEDGELSFTTYHDVEELVADHNLPKLDMHEQVSIVESWGVMNKLLDEGYDDPTSQYGEIL